MGTALEDIIVKVCEPQGIGNNTSLDDIVRQLCRPEIGQEASQLPVLDRVPLSKFEEKQMEFYGYMTEGVILLKGPAGSGKTMLMVAIAKNLNKYYGKPAVLDFHPTSTFGEYSFMDSQEFRKELKRVGKIAKEGVGDVAEEIREKLKIKFDNATIGWDEGYKKLDCRRHNDPEILIHGYYLQQWRHYHSTVIISTPRFDLIDAKRGLNQVTIELTCWSNVRMTPTRIYGPKNPRKWRSFAHGRDRFTCEPIDMSVPIMKYGPMYDSWAPIAIKQKLLRSAEEDDDEVGEDEVKRKQLYH